MHGTIYKKYLLPVFLLHIIIDFFASFYNIVSPLQDCKYNLCTRTYNLKPYTIQYLSFRVISQWIFSSYMFTYMWNDSYESLLVKSVGLNVFSLLGYSSSSCVEESSCGCVGILSLYLTLNFVIYSLIGTFKSACKTLLDIYLGAFTITRSPLFWYLCNISWAG